MTKTVWELTLEHMQNEIALPYGAHFLSATSHDGKVAVHFLVDPARAVEKWKVGLYGAGWDLPKDAKFMATVQNKAFTWHIFHEPLASKPEN